MRLQGAWPAPAVGDLDLARSWGLEALDCGTLSEGLRMERASDSLRSHVGIIQELRSEQGMWRQDTASRKAREKSSMRPLQ